jgi:hypothetical protein
VGEMDAPKEECYAFLNAHGAGDQVSILFELFLTMLHTSSVNC